MSTKPRCSRCRKPWLKLVSRPPSRAWICGECRRELDKVVDRARRQLGFLPRSRQSRKDGPGHQKHCPSHACQESRMRVYSARALARVSLFEG